MALEKQKIISPFMMAGILVVLLPIFFFITLDRMEKLKTHMNSRLLARGSALIRTFEAGTRTGMLTMNWGSRRIQAMLLETSCQPGISHIIITSENGTILAHSNAKKLGTIMDAMPDTSPLDEDFSMVSHRILNPSDTRIFEVFKRFTPLREKHRGRPGPMHPMDRKACRDEGGSSPGKTCDRPWFNAPHSPYGSGDHVHDSPLKKKDTALEAQYIFAGLSMAQVDSAQKQLIRKTIGSGILFFVLGCAGITALVAFQAYQTAKANLTRVKAFSSNIIQNMPAGLMTLSLDKKITSINKAAENILGDPVSAPPSEFIKLCSRIKGEKDVVSEKVTLNPDSLNERRLDVTISSVMDNQNQVQGVLFLFRDLTRLRQLKQEIETTRHLAAIGKLAAGVAHEIRNPLSSIKGFATYFMKQQENNEKGRQTAEIMIQEVERINRSITRLLEFARPVELKKSRVKIREIITHSLKLVQQDLDQKGIKVNVTYHTQKEYLTTDPEKINQVLLNLYINSIYALKESGEITLTISDADEGNMIDIKVADNGCGVDAKDLDALFDPYFTTRPNGTGLGLSIVQKIINSLDGEIRVESEKGKNTTFTITLPS